MDIVLEQLMEYVDQIAGLVSEAAPLVWEMLLAQAKVEAVGYGLLAFAGLLIIAFGTYCIKLKKDGGSYDMWELGIVFGYMIGFPMFLSGIYSAVARLINPAWYAIKLLISSAQ